MVGVSVRAWLREALLTGGAVLGVVCVLAAIGSTAFGLRPLIFRSGSMEPAIGTGALALARSVPADSVAPGDVVSVIAASGTRITHRVASVSPGPVTTLVLKGDANHRVDAEAYAVVRVDRVVAHVEHLGYVISWLRHPAAIFAGGVILGILIMVSFPPGSGRAPPGDPPPSRGSSASPPPRRARTATVAVKRRVGPVIMAVLILVVGGAEETRAAFVDQGAVTSGSFAALARVGAPTLSCTSLGVLGIQFSWTAVTGATGYDLVLTSTGGTTSTYSTTAGTTTTTVNGLVNSGTAVVRAKVTYPSTTWFSNASNTRSYSFIVATTCS